MTRLFLVSIAVLLSLFLFPSFFLCRDGNGGT